MESIEPRTEREERDGVGGANACVDEYPPFVERKLLFVLLETDHLRWLLGEARPKLKLPVASWLAHPRVSSSDESSSSSRFESSRTDAKPTTVAGSLLVGGRQAPAGNAPYR